MSEGNKPIQRIITKPEGSDKWVELGAIWKSASGQTTVTFSKPIEPGTRALVVENKPREAAKPTT